MELELLFQTITEKEFNSRKILSWRNREIPDTETTFPDFQIVHIPGGTLNSSDLVHM